MTANEPAGDREMTGQLSASIEDLVYGYETLNSSINHFRHFWNGLGSEIVADLEKRRYVIVPAASVPSPADVEAMRFARIVTGYVAESYGDEGSTEMIQEALHYAPPPDADPNDYHVHLSRLDAALARLAEGAGNGG